MSVVHPQDPYAETLVPRAAVSFPLRLPAPAGFGSSHIMIFESPTRIVQCMMFSAGPILDIGDSPTV